MKKMQHIHIIMLTLLFIGFVVSIGFTLNKFQVMLHSKNNVTTMINTLPILVQNKTPYSENDYKNALKMVDLSLPNINVDIKATQITITSSNIENEMNVRQLMTEILALDRNFYIESMCGNTTNSCNGNALEIVIKGEKRNTILSNTAL